MGFTFPATRRLRKRREYLVTQNGGVRVALPSCIVLLSLRPLTGSGEERGPARLGVTVTRKFGNAVERNRAKRVVRESFRLLPELFPHGIDLVVIPKGSAAGQLGLRRMCEEWRRAARLLATRADTLYKEERLKRAVAEAAEAAQTGGPKGEAV